MNKTELKKRMLSQALPVMTGYQTDLVYDFEVIDEVAKEGIPCLMSWQIRDTGTHLVRLANGESFDFALTCLEYNDYETVIVYEMGKGFEMGAIAPIDNLDAIAEKWITIKEVMA